MHVDVFVASVTLWSICICTRLCPSHTIPVLLIQRARVSTREQASGAGTETAERASWSSRAVRGSMHWIAKTESRAANAGYRCVGSPSLRQADDGW